jgi:hypothetical protein
LSILSHNNIQSRWEIVFLGLIIFFLWGLDRTNGLEEISSIAQKAGMGNIMISNPPDLRQLQQIVDDLTSQGNPILAEKYEAIIPLLTSAPFFQAMTYPISNQLYLLVTDKTVTSLTEEELYFIVGHELGHSRIADQDSSKYSLEEEIQADLSGLYALTYRLGGKNQLSEALKIIYSILDKIGDSNKGITPCYQRHTGLYQTQKINDSILVRKEALEEYAQQIKVGTLTHPLLEGIRIHEIGIDKSFSYILIKFSINQSYLKREYKYKKLVVVYEKKDRHWNPIWKYTDIHPLEARYTSFKAPFEVADLTPQKYKIWVKLFLLDNQQNNKVLATTQARAFFELE